MDTPRRVCHTTGHNSNDHISREEAVAEYIRSIRSISKLGLLHGIRQTNVFCSTVKVLR